MQTGDILIGRRFTGDATQWMLLSGGYANHAAMIVADPDSPQRMVIDCPSDTNYFNGIGGVRRLELNEWLGRTIAQGYDVAWLPLDKNLRAFGDLS